MKGFDKRLKRLFFKQLLIFYSLKIPSPNEEREVDLGTFVDQEEGDIDEESDVELDLDLDSEHNDDDLESGSGKPLTFHCRRERYRNSFLPFSIKFL